VRHRSVLFFVLLFIVVFRLPAQQQLSEEEKRRAFLKAREEMTTIPYTPSEPGPKPKPHATPAGEKPPRATPTPAVRPTPESTPRPKPTPVPAETPLPPLPPNIIVRESAVARADEEREPTPKPPSAWARLFGGGGGGGASYRYLTSAVRRDIDRAPVSRGRWRYIVVHNSGTRQGNAAAFEHYHRNVKRMVNGLAYHFVIGNGTSTRDGAIEIGNRWHRQIQGGHVHSDYLNNIAIGICLVGDFNVQHVGEAQKAALTELINYLRHRVGKIQGHPAEVRAHKNINPPQWPTDCPGNLFPYDWLARKFPEHYN
jgi:hypothetical protein